MSKYMFLIFYALLLHLCVSNISGRGHHLMLRTKANLCTHILETKFY